MMIRSPRYLDCFKCIAGECTDNCCIGWDIYIDDEARERYSGLRLKSGKLLEDYISCDGGAHFKMKDGRCPFLDRNGLCEIISSESDTALCEICREHPRFYTYLGETIEMGIGASCPTAAVLILTNDSTLTERQEASDGDKLEDEDAEALAVILCIREHIFEILKSDRSITDALHEILGLGEAMEEAEFDGKFSYDEIIKEYGRRTNSSGEGKEAALREIVLYYSELEHLDTSKENIFSTLLDDIDKKSVTGEDLRLLTREEEKVLKRVSEYIIYRYFTACLYSGEFSGVSKFCVLSSIIIGLLIRTKSIENAVFIFKEYSKQVEYNPETMEKLFLDLYSNEIFDNGRIEAILGY